MKAYDIETRETNTRLPDPRHERMAINLSLGMNKINAYEKAGFERNRAGASRLANKPEIILRVEQLRVEFAEKNKDRGGSEFDDGSLFDEEWACRKLNVLLLEAQSAQEFKEARACVKDICDIKGIGVTVKKKAMEVVPNGKSVPSPTQINFSFLSDAVKESGDGNGILPKVLRDITPGSTKVAVSPDGIGRPNNTDESTGGPNRGPDSRSHGETASSGS